jgi:protein AroM
MNLAVLFSGQARPSYAQLLRDGFSGTSVLIEGALDGLSADELLSIAPRGHERRIITELADGATVLVREDAETLLLQQRMESLAAAETSLMLLACTADFPALKASVPSLIPSRVLEGLVRAILPRHARLGILVPLKEQVPEVSRRWESRGYEVYCVAASPWDAPKALEVAATELRAAHPALVLMDCFAYAREHKERLRAALDALILLPQEVLVALALQLLN